jgi:hypothetical protein
MPSGAIGYWAGVVGFAAVFFFAALLIGARFFGAFAAGAFAAAFLTAAFFRAGEAFLAARPAFPATALF